ncbi:MAG: hypothetical protein COT16_03890 [Elusimicrobia bacterium CG08_land_8_20_14_0_20_44_26]|nr:MAG: hypothetical protein COT16_03890 [Elusimicrobia bacterium CG08_land_8_20_14_0_20_44_26]
MTEEAGILIEELGCSARTAGRVLTLCGNNLNQAYKWLASKHRNIVILKIKFATRSTYSCGLMFIALNTELKKVLRYAVSISQNPYVYYEDIDEPWHQFENKIYTQRLSEEIVHEKTIAAAQALMTFFQDPDSDSFYGIFDGVNYPQINEALRIVLRKLMDEDILFEFKKERISIFNFRRVPDGSNFAGAQFISRDAKIDLKVEVLHAKKRFFFHRPPTIEKINQGAIIFVRITDEREVAGYLARFIGISKSETIPVELLEKQRKDNGYFVSVRLGGMIRGFCIVPFKTHVEIFRD